MHPREADAAALIEALVTAGVEFLVVGGVAEKAQRARRTHRSRLGCPMVAPRSVSVHDDEEA